MPLSISYSTYEHTPAYHNSPKEGVLEGFYMEAIKALSFLHSLSFPQTQTHEWSCVHPPPHTHTHDLKDKSLRLIHKVLLRSFLNYGERLV